MTLTTSPLISVCVPTYRGATHLAPAIASVLGQTFSDFELVIIDDNSPDETPALVARYNDPRIRYLRNLTNLGPQGNWNKCLNEARGKYLKLLPHDDLLAPDCLARQIAVLEDDTDQKIALVFCARTIIDQYGRVLGSRGYSRARAGIVPSTKLTRDCFRYGTNLIGEPGAVLFRRQLARTVGSFDASQPYVIDLDYWFRLLVHGSAFYIAEPLTSFRVSQGSWSVAIGAEQHVDFCRFMERIARDQVYSIGAFDMIIGRQMARVNNLLRLLFYRVWVRSS